MNETNNEIVEEKDNTAGGGSLAKKSVVLGFSGGLDTSYCVKYLTIEKGYDVHSVIVNTGGFTDNELKEIADHAYVLDNGEVVYSGPAAELAKDEERVQALAGARAEAWQSERRPAV